MKLKDICSFQSGGTPSKSNPNYYNGSIPWITTVSLNGNTIDENNAVEWITELAITESAAKIVPEQSIMVGTRVGVGKTAINTVPMSTNQDIVSLIGIDESEWCKSFISKFLQSKRVFLNAQARGATIKGIKIEALANLDIPSISIEKQKLIVKTLDSLQNIILYRKSELLALDDLIKARFVEMFGDPTINPKNYPIVPISELFDVGSSKRVFESEWRDSGVPFYRAREIVKLSKDGYVNNELFIDEELYEKYKIKYGVPKADDMMVTGVGTLGICYIVRPQDRFYFKDGNTLWFKNKGICSVRFIMEQYNTDFVRNQIEANANVSTVGTYTITNAKNTLVLVPSIEEQKKFNSFVTQVDKSKAVIQKALDEAQLLFDSLMQQYFG